jgi:uncharacterized protein (TIGR00369 family)
LPNPTAEDIAPLLEQVRDGWNSAMDVHFVRATGDEVVVEWTIGPQHRQAYGIVHGGVYCGVIETLASVGAAIFAMPKGQSVVGLENHTSFIHAAREGKLTGVAKPLTRGRRTQLWEATITDATGRLVAKGTVRLLCLEADAPVAGGSIDVKPGM